MRKDKSRRALNLLKGNHNDKTKLQSGYNGNSIDHKEGDVWEENHKTWTIKNGIKLSISKLNEARKLYAIPLTCPNCGKPMNTKLDKKFYKSKSKCFDCVVNEDNNNIINGTFDSIQKEIITKNSKSYLLDLKTRIDDYIDQWDNQKYISEHGDIEDWDTSLTKEQLSEMLYKQLDDVKQHLIPSE